MTDHSADYVAALEKAQLHVSEAREALVWCDEAHREPAVNWVVDLEILGRAITWEIERIDGDEGG